VGVNATKRKLQTLVRFRVNEVVNLPLKYQYKYEWDKLKWHFFHDFNPIHDRITLKDVSDRYNVPYQTVRRYAAKDRWHGDRAWMRAFQERESADQIVREALGIEVR